MSRTTRKVPITNWSINSGGWFKKWMRSPRHIQQRRRAIADKDDMSLSNRDKSVRGRTRDTWDDMWIAANIEQRQK